MTPRFRYRDQLWNNNATPEWLARMRVNGEYARLPEARGGSARVALGCHSLDYLIPAELFDKHPEWFAVKEDGKRHRCPEYCLTNEGLRAYVLAKVREELRADPGIEYYWVSQNDGSLSGCFCEAYCRTPAPRRRAPHRPHRPGHHRLAGCWRGRSPLVGQHDLLRERHCPGHSR